MLLLYSHGDHTAPYQRNVGLHRITTDQISSGPEIHWTKGQQVNVSDNTNDFNTVPLLIIEYDFVGNSYNTVWTLLFFGKSQR